MTDHSRIIAVTDRHYFDGREDPEREYLEQIRRLFSLQVRAVVLREKDLSPQEYTALARKVRALEEEGNRGRAEGLKTKLILHQFPEAAEQLGVTAVHLPLGRLKTMFREEPERLKAFSLIGTSVHSVEDALQAVQCGAGYCFAGNVYETTCKPGLKGRGLKYLRDVAAAVPVLVYGIGGITLEKMEEVLETGAAGGCMMSGSMRL